MQVVHWGDLNCTASPKSNGSSHSSGNDGDDEEEQSHNADSDQFEKQCGDIADESNESACYHQTKVDPQRDYRNDQVGPPQVKSLQENQEKERNDTHNQTVEYDTLLGNSNAVALRIGSDDILDSMKPHHTQIQSATLFMELSGIFDAFSGSESTDYNEYTQLVDQLEDVVNKEMSDCKTQYDEHRDLQQEFTTDNNQIDVMIQCSRQTDDADYNTAFACNNRGSHDSTTTGSGRDNNNNNNGDSEHNESNNNRGSGDEDDPNVATPQSVPCNHLSTCPDCRFGWTQKCDRIKAQHARYVSFLERVHKVIANAKQKANKKSKSKNRRKTTHTVKTNQSRYCPPFEAIAMPNTFAPTVKEPIAPRSYLYKSIAMQNNDKQLDMNQTNVFVNVDLHEEKSNESLYCVMSKIEHERCHWQLVPTLCTKNDLGPTILPQSSRIALQYTMGQ